MTKYTTLEKKEGKKKTVFNKFVGHDNVYEAKIPPQAYDNVLFICNKKLYGDVFLAWDDDDSEGSLYFGEKGDEFDS